MSLVFENSFHLLLNCSGVGKHQQKVHRITWKVEARCPNRRNLVSLHAGTEEQALEVSELKVVLGAPRKVSCINRG